MRILLPICAFILLAFSTKARTYYSRQTGNWASNTSWSTVAYGYSTNGGTFPGASDTANVGDGVTITITANASTTDLNIGQGASGIVDFTTALVCTLTVSKNIMVNANAKFWYNANSAAGKTHICNVAGNFINYGTVDFNFDANDFLNITFNGSLNSTVSGTGTFDMKNVTMNKSTSAYNLEVTATTFESTINSLVVTAGNYIHNNTSTYNVNPSTSLLVGPNVIFTATAGTLTFSSAATTLTLQGGLVVNGGDVIVGASSGTQGIRTDQSGGQVAFLTISSGSLCVYGGITYKAGSGSKPFAFIMSGGSLKLNFGSTGTNTELLKITDVVGSSFTMAGGTIVFQKPNSAGATSVDVDICGTTGAVNVTGGTFQFGNALTALNSSFNFQPYVNATYPNMIITGPSGNGNKLCTAAGSNDNAHFKIMSLRIESGSSFDNRSLSAANGDRKNMTIVGSDASNIAFYNDGTFTPRIGRVIFAGSAQQIIDGTSSIAFYELEMSSTSYVTLNQGISVTSDLVMTNGVINTTNTDYVTVAPGAACSLGNTNSYVSGPMVRQVTNFGTITLNYPIGGSSGYHPLELTVQHSSVSQADYWCKMQNSSAMALPYTLPSSLSRVSYTHYYQFVRSGASNFTSGSLKIYYFTDDVVTDYTTLRVAQASGSAWIDQGGMGTANTTGTIVSNSFNSFTQLYALGNSTGGTNPLPVELIDFRAIRDQTRVLLDWKTASEVNNDHFEVLRATDSGEFIPIGILAGAGNSTMYHDYFFSDQSPVKGNNYYKLRQVDFDGRSFESEVKKIRFGDETIFAIFPSVSDGSNVFISFPESVQPSATLSVLNSEGRLVRQDKVNTDSNRDRMPDLPSGSYHAILQSGEDFCQRSFVIIR